MTDHTDLIRRLREPTVTISQAMREREQAADAIETLLAERDKLTEQNKVLFDSALLAAQERDAALADARRYRWIRDNHETAKIASEIVFECSGDEWDRAIDAAMQESSDDQA